MGTVYRWLRIGCCWLLLVGSDRLTSEARGADAELEAGHPFVQNFAAREYGADNQVWSAVQDSEGIMYFGNKGVLLEYDGSTWRKIFVSDNHYDIRGLANDPVSRTVYVGGMDDLGFLKNDADGGKVFVSLLDRLPAGDRAFGSIFRVFATGEGIFFIGIKQVMRWRDGAFTLWKFPAADRLQSECSGGNLYIQSPGVGLLRLQGDRFLAAADDPFFQTNTLSGLAPGPDGSLVIGTRYNGIFTLRGGVLAPLDCGLNPFFKSYEVRKFLRLRDGSLAVATGMAGIVMLDGSNRFQGRWDEASGLQNQVILNLFEDREGGVWVCSYAGISRVQNGSPFSVFDGSNGLKRTSIHSIQRYHGTIYVATDSGLYRLVPADPSLGVAARCERVGGMNADYWGLCASEHGLLIAGLGTIYQFEDDGRATLIDNFFYSGAFLSPSRRHPERVFWGTRADLRSLRYDKKAEHWLDEGPIPGIAAEIHTCVESPEGDLWVGSIDRGLFRVKFAPDDASSGRRGAGVVSSYLGRPGSLEDAVAVKVSLSPEGKVIVCTRKGLYRYDARSDKFLADTEYGRRFADGTFEVDSLMPDPQAGVWLTSRSTKQPWLDQQGGWAKAGREDGSGSTFEQLPRQIFDKLTAIDLILPEASGVVWLASPDGIVRLNARDWQRAEKPVGFRTLIRRATASARAAAVRTGSKSAAPIALNLSGTDRRLDHAHNSVQFELAADTYAPGADLLYRTRLRGFGDGQWGIPEARTRVEYTNLAAGNYVFEARAQNADGELGQLAQVGFVVVPAWQNTGLAYLSYAISAGLGVAGLVRWRLMQLRAANARLEALVATRTDELRVHQVELERARDAADATNRAKTAFLANMSHELRTPLNAVLGYTQIMLNDPDLSARNRERLTVVGHSGNHLLGMINEVLDISKIEAGKLTVDSGDFSLAGLLHEVGAAFEPRMVEKGLRFKQETSGQPPGGVHADAGKLRQVLFNLLSNALKFTRRGEVRLTVHGSGDDRWRFEVLDTGAGMDESDLSNLFVAFHQGSAGKASSQGTGLGLAISRRLVELLGGQLLVESAVGKGSRFWFELRLPAVASPALAPAERDERKITGYRGARRRLLVADDEPVNRQIVREMLEPLGFVIEEAGDGAQALESCARQPLDALLLDLRMQPVNGFEVARSLRRQQGDGQIIKIIAISASVFESDQQYAIDAGCDVFLPKPFVQEDLVATIGRLLILEWVFDSAPAYHPPAAVPLDDSNDAIPPQQEIAAMLELSLRGDIRGIKKRLAGLLATDDGQDYAGFVRRLEPLVAGYQMDRIRDILARCKTNGNAHD